MAHTTAPGHCGWCGWCGLHRARPTPPAPPLAPGCRWVAARPPGKPVLCRGVVHRRWAQQGHEQLAVQQVHQRMPGGRRQRRHALSALVFQRAHVLGRHQPWIADLRQSGPGAHAGRRQRVRVCRHGAFKPATHQFNRRLAHALAPRTGPGGEHPVQVVRNINGGTHNRIMMQPASRRRQGGFTVRDRVIFRPDDPSGQNPDLAAILVADPQARGKTRPQPAPTRQDTAVSLCVGKPP
jgi:hypothetical protein